MPPRALVGRGGGGGGDFAGGGKRRRAGEEVRGAGEVGFGGVGAVPEGGQCGGTRRSLKLFLSNRRKGRRSRGLGPFMAHSRQQDRASLLLIPPHQVDVDDLP